jgi:hypothetical protein
MRKGEEWKDGKVEDWKNGIRRGGWKSGRVDADLRRLIMMGMIYFYDVL